MGGLLLRVGLLLLVAALMDPAIAQAPNPSAPGATPASPPPVASAGQATAQPAAEEAFIKAVEDSRQAYTTGLNDMVKGVARARRADALCRATPKGRVENWVGKLAVLGSSAGGKGIVSIDIAPKVTLATNKTEAADDKDKTLIDVRSPLFAYAAVLAVGDRVMFSGTLLPGTDDCFKEVGKDLATTMTAPEFVFRLEAIKKVLPPPANAVLSGQAAPMSIAQSSDFVRDAVDTIASAVACGAESRKVFGIIIKVMIRASAGQSVEQRDNLISLMFSPPSAQTQNKENCEAKLQALDRLDADAG